MRFIIVRHGQTEDNVTKTIQGQLPGKLTEKGKEQAEKVGMRLKDENIDIAYVSDLERAKETAEKILQYHPETKIEYVKELRERHWGIWQGKPSEERTLFLKENDKDVNDYQPQGGETFAQVQQRMVEFYHHIVEKHKNKTVLLVSHGGALAALYLSLFQKSREEYKKYHPQNAAVTVLEISEDKKHTVHVLNCVKHLD